jgi:hypothetical protein
MPSRPPDDQGTCGAANAASASSLTVVIVGGCAARAVGCCGYYLLHQCSCWLAQTLGTDGRTDGCMHPSPRSGRVCRSGCPRASASLPCFRRWGLGGRGDRGEWGDKRPETHTLYSVLIYSDRAIRRATALITTLTTPLPPLLPPPRVALSVPPCPHLQLLQRPRLQQPPRPRSTPSGWAVSHYCCARRARKRLSLATT